MSTVYILVVLVMINGAPHVSPPIPFTTNQDCQTTILVLKKWSNIALKLSVFHGMLQNDPEF